MASRLGVQIAITKIAVKAGANAFASVALCMIAVCLGYLLGLSLNNGKRV